MLLEAAVTTNGFPVGVREAMPVRKTVCVPAFLATVRLAMGPKVGGKLETTVTVKLWLTRLLLAQPLFTVTVTTAVPTATGFGLRVNMAMVAGLAYRIDGAGSRPGLLEVTIILSV